MSIEGATGITLRFHISDELTSIFLQRALKAGVQEQRDLSTPPKRSVIGAESKAVALCDNLDVL